MSSQANTLKSLLVKKGDVKRIPSNGDIAVIVKERVFSEQNKRYVEVGVGKVMKYQRYFDVIGYAVKDVNAVFAESSVRTQISEVGDEGDNAKIIVATFPTALMRTIDEARWDDRLQSVGDLIKLLQELEL